MQIPIQDAMHHNRYVLHGERQLSLLKFTILLIEKSLWNTTLDCENVVWI